MCFAAMHELCFVRLNVNKSISPCVAAILQDYSGQGVTVPSLMTQTLHYLAMSSLLYKNLNLHVTGQVGGIRLGHQQGLAKLGTRSTSSSSGSMALQQVFFF